MSKMISNKKVHHFKGQKYSHLKKQHVKGKRLFNDPIFPAINATIGDFNNLPGDIEWKRPGELCETPCIFDESLNPEAIKSGSFSCGWFVSACTVLAGVGELCYRVIPDYWKQEWSREKPEEYAGIFHFQFWRFGEWVDVVIDDQLPTSNKTLLFTRSGKPNEFWVALLEKAYAKLHGSYKALDGGHLSDALVDFTGGVSEIVDLKRDEVSEHAERSASLFHDLQKEISDHSLICCVHSVINEEEVGTRTETGIYRGYAYAVTGAKKISLGETSLRTLFKGREKFSMVRLRDIVGVCISDKPMETEEKSEASFVYSTSHLARLMSTSQEWSKIKESEINRMGLSVDYKTEFWMPLEDFVKNFTEITVCHLYNTNLFALSRTWKEAAVRGSWGQGAKDALAERGGGSAESHDMFLKNPQYMFDIKNYEEEVVIQMLQWDPTVPHQVAGLPNLLIGFSIIQVENNRKYRLHKQWEHNPSIVTINYIRKREIFYKGHIPKGRYVLIPTTHRPGEVGGYLIRFFTSSAVNLRLISRDAPRKKCYCCRAGYPIWVTMVNVKGAENLKKIDRLGSCDAYCSITCEGKTAKTHTVKNSLDPIWNSAFIFYRSQIEKPLSIKVFNHNSCLPDNFVGQVSLPATVNHHPTPIGVDLMQRGKNENEPAQGTLHLEIFTSENFMMV